MRLFQILKYTLYLLQIRPLQVLTIMKKSEVVVYMYVIDQIISVWRDHFIDLSKPQAAFFCFMKNPSLKKKKKERKVVKLFLKSNICACFIKAK